MDSMQQLLVAMLPLLWVAVCNSCGCFDHLHAHSACTSHTMHKQHKN
jgi:hypothetical protein